MVDLNSARSPRFRSRFHEDLEGDLASELAAEEAGSGSSHLAPHRPPAARRKRPRAPRSGYTGSDNEGGSFYDSDSLRSRGSRASDRPKLADAPFAIKRLLEDLGQKLNQTLLRVLNFNYFNRQWYVNVACRGKY